MKIGDPILVLRNRFVRSVPLLSVGADLVFAGERPLGHVVGYAPGYTSFIYVFSLLQSAVFGGMATGFTLGADFGTGFMRRMMLVTPHRGAILVGADPADLETARPVLTQMGARVVLCGERVGDGQAVKLVNQLLCSVHLVAAGEALAFARRLGLDPARVLATIETGAASSFMLSDRGPRMLAAEAPVLSAIDIFVKDSGLVLAAAREAGAATPLTEAAHRMFTAAADRGLGREDDSRVIRLYEGATAEPRPQRGLLRP